MAYWSQKLYQMKYWLGILLQADESGSMNIMLNKELLLHIMDFPTVP